MCLSVLPISLLISASEAIRRAIVYETICATRGFPIRATRRYNNAPKNDGLLPDDMR